MHGWVSGSVDGCRIDTTFFHTRIHFISAHKSIDNKN